MEELGERADRPKARYYTGPVMASDRQHGKITPALESRIGADQSDGLLDVIIELESDAPNDAPPSVPKLREAFEQAAQPVGEVVTRLGGEVTDLTWLNRTLRAKVPAAGVHELSGLDGIAALDVPHRITPD
jgi:hypothetical protein